MQTFIESPLFLNLLYLCLVAGFWVAAWAVVVPGTGFLEGLALAILALAGLGMLAVPINYWAFGLLFVGIVLFLLSVWRKWTGVWLGLSAFALSLGSIFLFKSPVGGLAVHPLLAVVVSLLTVGFFWLSLSKALEAYRTRLAHDLETLLGRAAEVRTEIDPVGSVFVAGELWTATAETKIPVGAQVRVTGREGLTLMVEPAPANPGDKSS
jgi:membrane-bound serine protease (ClpP class)